MTPEDRARAFVRLAYDSLEPEEEWVRILAGSITAAVEAEQERCARVVMELEFVVSDDPFAKWTTKGGSFARQAAAAIRQQEGP